MSTPTPTFWVKKHPSPASLAVALVNLPADAAPGEYEQMTEPALEEWKAAEIAAGWVPEAEAPPAPAVRTASQWAFWKALVTLHPTITEDAVRALLPGLISDPVARALALNDLNRAQSVHSNNALIPLVQYEYDLTDAQVVAVFDLADTF